MKKHVSLVVVISAFLCAGVNCAFAQVNNHARAIPKVTSRLTWHTNYNNAMQTAQQQNKPLFLFFTGSDWCGWCKKMDQEIFSTQEFAQQAGNDFVFVELDFPMNQTLSPQLSEQNTKLKQRFGVSGFPTVILLDPNGNFIAESGYRPGGGAAYAAYIKQLVTTPSN